MSPFDMFLLAVFVITAFKATVDAYNFWKESEELAIVHFKAVDASARVRRANSAVHPNYSPKHIPAPTRKPNMPHNVHAGAMRTRAIKTGLPNRKPVSRKQRNVA